LVNSSVGKFDVEAALPVHPVVLEYLDRHPNKSSFVFPGRFGGSIHPTTLWGWVREVGAEVDVKVPTHVLRHTALAVGNDVTGDLRSVQDFARHAEPTTTAGYTRTTNRRLIAVSDAIGSALQGGDALGMIDDVPVGPTLSFGELIATIEGSHAVAPWLELADTLEGREGWRLRGSNDGAGIIEFAFPAGDLSACVLTRTNGSAPSFSIARRIGPTDEDIVVWNMGDAATLGALVSTFEAGGVPFPPTANYVDDGEEECDERSSV
jgi:hypothetical protein